LTKVLFPWDHIHHKHLEFIEKYSFSCSIIGIPLICGAAKEQDYYGTFPMPMSYSLNNTQAMLAQSCPDGLSLSFAFLRAQIPHKRSCIKCNRKNLVAAALLTVTIDRGVITIR
jgi:hypothetical protein